MHNIIIFSKSAHHFSQSLQALAKVDIIVVIVFDSMSGALKPNAVFQLWCIPTTWDRFTVHSFTFSISMALYHYIITVPVT